MSPTVFRFKGYRFFFFSREESRMHIHVHHGDGEAKFWIEPDINLVRNIGFDQKQITEIMNLIKENKDVIKNAWNEHFGS